MKKILVSFILIVGASSLFAQSFEQGNVVISAGYGFPNLGKAVFVTAIKNGDPSASSGITASGIGPLHAKFEYAISDNIGIGLSANFVNLGVKYTDTYNYEYKRSALSILARFNFHFANSDKLDPYVGVGAGYNSVSNKLVTNDPNGGGVTFKNLIPVGFETVVGLRYYFTDNIGLYSELGFAKSLIQAGVVAKF